MEQIRNFCIIAHIDHGKSTLADRFLELTGTVEKRRMKEQYLDQLELERERGITIKMAPVRMTYRLTTNDKRQTTESRELVVGYKLSNSEYILNLIDTPGHSDFSYEVSRALAAVEGAILLVDATQGIQAQTLANFYKAKEARLTIIGVVNKIDLFKDRNDERVQKIVNEVAELLSVRADEIYLISGKTGEGIPDLLAAVIDKVPSPTKQINLDISDNQRLNLRESALSRALIFDSFYDNHKGVVASVRVFDGAFSSDDEITLIARDAKTKIKEVGYFFPELKPFSKLSAGEIGYIATGIKDPGKIKIGDTIIIQNAKIKIQNYETLALLGYKEPQAVVFVSFYPEDADEFELLKKGLEKLRLNDSALTIMPDQNEVLGRGFKVGFLGRLHFEITAERLEREYALRIVNTFPSVMYRIKENGAWKNIIRPEELNINIDEIQEPMVEIEILVPREFLGNVMRLHERFRMAQATTVSFGERIRVRARMPLAELVSDFDDQLKSVSGGYGSFHYEHVGYEKADVVRVDMVLAGTLIHGLSRFLHKSVYEREGRRMVERLKELLPRQQFTQAIQAVVNGRVIAREDIPALKKDVTGYLYGGDRTRKMKLWQKQKRGKKKLKEMGQVRIPPNVFRELLKK